MTGNALEDIEELMQMEKDIHQFYKQASDRLVDTKVCSVFHKLSRDAIDHLEVLEMQYESLASYETWMVFQELYGSSDEYGEKKKHIFDYEKLHDLIVEGMTSKEAVHIGIKLLKDAIKVYSRQAKTCNDPSGCLMYQKLASFKKEHLSELEKLSHHLKN